MISHSLASTCRDYSWEQHHPKYTLKNPKEIQQREDLGLTYSNDSALVFLSSEENPKEINWHFGHIHHSWKQLFCRTFTLWKASKHSTQPDPKSCCLTHQFLHKFIQIQFAKYILNIWTHQILSGLFLQWSISSAGENFSVFASPFWGKQTQVLLFGEWWKAKQNHSTLTSPYWAIFPCWQQKWPLQQF